jgi:hypothetical protein
MTEPSTAHLFLSDEDTARCMADRHEAWMHPEPGELPGESYGRGRFYHFHGVSHLPNGRFKSVLCLGSAQGGEFLAIIDRIDELTIVEPSQKLRSHRLGDLQPRYVDSSSDTTLPFPDSSFDLVFCLSVLRHIPKVSAQVRELARVLPRGVHARSRADRVSRRLDWSPQGGADRARVQHLSLAPSLHAHG